VDLTGIVEVIQNSGLSEWLRSSLKAMPIIEGIHVMALATVFGSIFIVDLRLLGYPNTERTFSRLHHELLRWTWGAFGIAVVTGVLLFMVNAITYYNNTAFRLKLVAIVLAGINMAVFELVTAKSVPSWDRGVPTPTAARVAGALSIVLWVSVIFFGRWIGFTKGYDFAIPEDVQFDFSFPAE
jgi:hypothetical protein